MDKNYNFKLIDGTFTPSEVSHILFDLISSKIHFHAMENFRSQERFGKDVAHSQKRIQDLQTVRDELKVFFDDAEKNNLTLKVDDSVIITMVE